MSCDPLPSSLALSAIAVLVSLSASTASAQSTAPPPNNLPNGYITVLNWAKLPDGRRFGATAGVDVAPDGSIWAYDRCGINSCVDSDLDPILHFDPNGRLLGSFGAGLFNFPHGISVDADGNIWVTDHGVDPPNGKGQQVFKFNSRGKELLSLGRAGIAGTGQYTFNQPSDVLVAPSGDIFVADGHGPATNARIVRYSADGTFIRSWGRHGFGPNELEGPHGLAMDSQGRLFVADRTNNRIQIFNQNGTLLDSWTQFGRPSGLFIDQGDLLYVADSESRDNEGGYGHNPQVRRGIRIGSAVDGTVTAFIPDPAERAGTSGAEGVAVDHDGNIYGAEVGPRDVKKYIKR
ncbi:MAG: peptidyl-alpha-hydroxyglycine alpha-amidating lyase family protein [Acidobacteriota bacterium]|nr:peptidyl-alpha-hydroxyglycine alpha-amidating lyase family protein [Acidobacteriota bacterium]